MSCATANLAPAWECARLVLRLSYNPFFNPAELDTLHELLRTYPAAEIAKGVEEACVQLVEEGYSPEWPDNGQASAFVLLLDGLWELASISEQRLMPAA